MAGKKKKRGRKKIVLFVFEILLLGVLLGVLWLYNTTLGQVEFDDDALSASEAGINEDIDEDALANMHGYLNVALFGLDNRSNGSYNEGNSDSIIELVEIICRLIRIDTGFILNLLAYPLNCIRCCIPLLIE